MPESIFASSEFLSALNQNAIQWQRHILERMTERLIARLDIIQILSAGEIIEAYPEDTPYPSALFLGWVDGSPLHVVAAYSMMERRIYVITAYEPDEIHFEKDFKTRKNKNELE